MGRPRQVSDHDILSTARRCFVERGPGISTAVIAEALGISPPALFNRFGSKEELMIAALSPPAIPPFVEKLTAGPDDRPIGRQLLEIAEDVSAYFEELSPRLVALRTSGISPEELIKRYDTPPPVVVIRALAGWLSRAHERGLIAEVDFPAAAVAFLGTLHIPHFLTHVLGRSPVETDDGSYRQTIVDVFAQGLGGTT
jgi:AcrR family transcriptional regulator